MRQIREQSSSRTDLAIEAFDSSSPMEGLEVDTVREPGVTITRVRVLTEQAGRQIGKPPGNYITLDAPDLRDRNQQVADRVQDTLSRELAALLHLEPDAMVLVVGLGNRRATPDALGPRVLEEVLITRHLEDYVPEDLRGRLRSVCGLTPGVLGITGIETGEIIKGIVDRVQPRAVVAVDALAARSLDRILTTIQLADTGIHPGSGVGNNRAGITVDYLGVPVVAVGIPTVVHAATIASDTIDMLARKWGTNSVAPGSLGTLSGADRQRLIGDVLQPTFGNLMVTPKEIDIYIQEMAQVVAAGINRALHPDLGEQDAALLMKA